MIKQIKWLEKQIMSNFGGSFNETEETNYWDILEIMEAENPFDNSKKSFSSQDFNKNNAAEFFNNHPA